MEKPRTKMSANNKFYGRASLDCSMQGVRGGEARRKRNLSQVVVDADGKYQLRVDAMSHEGDEHKRLNDTEITLLSRGRTVFKGTIAQLAIRLHTE